jgi:benzoylformate decarboxylase
MSLPMDLQMELGELDTSGVQLHDTRVRPPLASLERAADVLASARNPAILAGSRVVERDGVQDLVAVAEALGAPVFTEPNHTHGRLGFPANHPLYAQVIPHWSPQIREALEEFDVLLVAGMDLVRQYVYHEPSCPVPEHIKVVHLDEDARELGKNLPIEVGLLGDTKAGLQELGTLLAPRLASHASQIAERRKKREDRHTRDRENLCTEIDKQRSIRPMTPKVLMDTIARRLPENVAVVEEAVTTTNTVLERLGALKNTTGYFGHRGWGLGWGLNCAIGAQLAWPARPVMAILGEGAALYGIQGLWSAAKYRLGVTFVIANNAQYQILKAGARGLGLPEANREKFVGMDLREPEVDLVGLAKAFGVDAVRVTEPEELDQQLQSSLGSGNPKLIDVPIRRSLAGPGE